MAQGNMVALRKRRITMLSGLSSVHFRCVRLAFFVVSACSFIWGTSPAAAAAPQLPLTYIDTSVPGTTGTTWTVNAGGSLQTVLNAAQLGDKIVIQAGAVFKGPFTLPNKTSGTGWITVRTSTPDGSFPSPGTRVTPAHAPLMPKLVVASGAVITTAPGAHHYRFIGVEISPTPNTYLYNLVDLSSPDGSAAGLPHDIIFDRSYLHGDPVVGTRRGIALNSRATAVIDSYLSDFKEVGADSQAICGWNGPGPFKIVNNYLEGAGENVMFGGADPSIPNLVPGDIEIRRNNFAKRLTWKSTDPSYSGTYWTVKNLFELKNAQRVLIEGNVFERNWGFQSDQNGYAILFTPRNQNGTAPWSVVQDVTFRNNIVRNSGGGIGLLGKDTVSGSLQRVSISNNLWYDIDKTKWTGTGWWFGDNTAAAGGMDLVVEHNTAILTNASIMLTGEASAPAMTFRNNLVSYGVLGIYGDGIGANANAAIAYFVPGSTFSANAFFNNTGASWPPPNYPPTSLFAPSVAAVNFTDQANDNYQLTTSSPYRNAATDGKDIGVDFAALAAAFGGGTAAFGGGTTPLAPSGLSVR
jgi:hypothetical protein